MAQIRDKSDECNIFTLPAGYNSASCSKSKSKSKSENLYLSIKVFSSSADCVCRRPLITQFRLLVKLG